MSLWLCCVDLQPDTLEANLRLASQAHKVALLMPAAGAAPFWMDDPAPVEMLRLRRMPLLAAAIAFALGEMCAHTGQLVSFFVAGLLLLLLLAWLALKRAPRVAMVAALAVWAVLGCWCAGMEPSAPQRTQLNSYADGLSRTVRGRVVRVRMLPAPVVATPAANAEQSRPWLLEPGASEAEGTAPTESVDLALTQVEDVTPDVSSMQPVGGGLRVTLLDGHVPLACGDSVELPLRLREPQFYRDAGAPSFAQQLAREDIDVTGNVKASKVVLLQESAPAPPRRPWLDRQHVQCKLYAAQAWASGRLAGFVPSPANRLLPGAARLTADDAGLLAAMLFGDRAALRPDLRVGFERTGSFHLFVVSGMHVGLLAGFLYFALRRLRAAQGLATLLTLLGTAAYAALTGLGLPAQRALLMVAVFLVARWLWRDISILQAIGAAALVVLAFHPRALGEASFQMTFLALIAVSGLALPLAERWLMPRIRATHELQAIWLDARLPPHLAQLRLMLRLWGRAVAALPLPGARRVRFALPAFALRMCLRVAELALVGLVVEACMALPMTVYFHRATPLALPANILAVPLVAVLAPLAVLTFCASLASPWLAAAPAALTALALHGIRALVEALSRARLADVRVPAPAPVIMAGIVIALAAACWAVRSRRRPVLAAGVLLVACAPVAALWPERPLLHPGVLEVTALDVGQGDSLLVVSPDGHTMLVDAGGPVGIAALAHKASESTGWDVGEQVVAPYLWSRRLRRLDAVLLTHAHSDHMGGMPAILRDFRPRELWVSVDPAESPEYKALLALAEELGVRVRHFRAGDADGWGGARINVLSPEPMYTGAAAPGNDDSLVVEVDFGQASVLLEGDAEKPSEQAMLAAGRLTPVTLLKVGHHGSKTSTNPEFLAAVAPRAAVISDGRRNTFGHPRYEVLERLEAAHVKTVRVDHAGATTFLLAADGSVETQSAAQ